MYTHEQKVTHVTNVRLWGMKMNDGCGKHADDLPPKTYFNTNFPCQWKWECPHGFQCGGLHPYGSIGMKKYQADNNMSAARCVELFPCCCPVEYLWSDEDMKGYYDDETDEWIAIGIDHYSTEELKKQGWKVAQAKRQALSDRTQDVTVTPKSRWGSTTAQRVVPDGMGSTQGLEEPKTDDDQLLAAVTAQSILQQELASVKNELVKTKKELAATVVERNGHLTELVKTRKEATEAENHIKKLYSDFEFYVAKSTPNCAYNRLLDCKDDEIASLTESLATAQEKNATLTKRCVAAEMELKAKPVEVPVENIVEKIVYVDHIYEGWHQLLSKVPRLVRAANVKAAEVELIKSENVRERFATLAQATVEVERIRVMKTLKESFTLKKAMLEKEAASKLQVVMADQKYFGSYSQWRVVDMRTLDSLAKTNNIIKVDVNKEAYAAQQQVFLGQSWTVTAGIVMEQGHAGPTSMEETDIQRLISMVSGLTARLASLEAEVSALKAERATGNGQ